MCLHHPIKMHVFVSLRLEVTPYSDSHHWQVEVAHVTSQRDDTYNFLCRFPFKSEA